MDEKGWMDIRNEYVTTNMSYRRLAKKHGVPERTIAARCSKEGWVAARSQFRQGVASAVENAASDAIVAQQKSAIEATDLLLEAIFSKLNYYTANKIPLAAQDIKSISSALKDINTIRGVKTDLDLDEQRARIDKLRKDAERDSDEPKNITVRIEGSGDWTD